jgi:site-specific DNA-methyltransferase (adenine-specific)
MAGFEIRDQLMWLYASGFPKAQDIGKAIQKRQGVEETRPQKGLNAYANQKPLMERMSFNNLKVEDYPPKNDEVIPTSPEAKQWSGWKTALKPAHEPIVMARKPFSGSTIDNVLTHGTGALNIDASRIAYADENKPKAGNRTSSFHQATGEGETSSGGDGSGGWNADAVGRFPSNVLGEVEGYQKFFYCPKVSRAERHVGFEKMPEPLFGDVKGCYDDGKRFAAKHQEYQQTGTLKRMKDAYAKANQRPRGEAFGDGNVLKDATETSGNNHPTVKPVELMKYLVRLVTPKGGKVLDPFNGSGSTGMACVELGYEYTGCELDPEYIEIANKRIKAWENKHKGFVDLFEED